MVKSSQEKEGSSFAEESIFSKLSERFPWKVYSWGKLLLIDFKDLMSTAIQCMQFSNRLKVQALLMAVLSGF